LSFIPLKHESCYDNRPAGAHRSVRTGAREGGARIADQDQ
jgi:hypothetical protein